MTCVLVSVPVWLTPTVDSVTNVSVDSMAIPTAGRVNVMAVLMTVTARDDVCPAATLLAETTAKGSVWKMLIVTNTVDLISRMK